MRPDGAGKTLTAEERKALLEAERAAIVAELPADEPHHSDEA
ncbi:hypothetical protein ACN9MU_03845 [Pseudoduganella sp. R-32]